MDELPIALRNSIESGNCVLFVGAGVGHYCKSQAAMRYRPAKNWLGFSPENSS